MTGTDHGARGDVPDDARLPAPGPVEDALITRLQMLSDELDDRPSPEFVESTRTRLVAMAAVRATGEQPVVTAAGSAVRPPVPARGWRGTVQAGRQHWRAAVARTRDTAGAGWPPRLVAGLAGGALLVAVLGTLVALSQGAKPGDVLYSVKRGSEQVEVALAGDDRGTTLLHLATTRLHELDELTRSSGTALPFGSGTGPDGRPMPLAAGRPAELFVETLRTMDEQTAEGMSAVTRTVVDDGDPALLSVVAEWTAGQRRDLAELEPRLPADVREDAARSLALLDDVGAREEALRTAVDCPSGPAVTGQDELGPVPTTCAPGPGTPAGPTTPSGSSTSSTAASASPGAPPPPSESVVPPETDRQGGERPPTSAAPATGSAPTADPSGGPTPSTRTSSPSPSPTTDARPRPSPPAGPPSATPTTGRPSSPPPGGPPGGTPTTGRPSGPPRTGPPSTSHPAGSPPASVPARPSNAGGSSGPPPEGRDESPSNQSGRPSNTASAQPSSPPTSSEPSRTSPPTGTPSTTPTGTPTGSPTGQPSDGPPAGPPDDRPSDPPGNGTPPSDPPGKGGPPSDPPGKGTPPRDPPGQGDPPGNGNSPSDPPGSGTPPSDPPGNGNPPSDPPGRGDPPDTEPSDPPGQGNPPESKPADPPGKGDPLDNESSDPPGKGDPPSSEPSDGGSTHGEGSRIGPR